jgi:cell division septum initiation protein DivIVA
MSTGLESQPDLPVGFRGYDRTATDAVLSEFEERQSALAEERDELRRQVEELVHELAQHRDRSQAVADALVTAQQVAADLRAAGEVEIAEKRGEVAAERAKIAEEAQSIRAEARQEATEIVREARLRADRLIEEVVTALEAYRAETDQFVVGTRERLASLVRDLLGRIPGSAPDPLPVTVEVQATVDPPAADAAAA